MLPHSQIKNLLSDDQLMALGEVAANSAQLEWTLGWVLMWLLNLTDVQRIALLKDLMFRQRLGLLQLHGKESLTDEADKDQLKQLTKRLATLYDDRNTVIHGTWGPRGSHISFEDALDMKFGNKPPDGVSAENQKNTDRVYEAAELRKLADDLHNIRGELWNFARGHWWKTWTKLIWNKEAAKQARRQKARKRKAKKKGK